MLKIERTIILGLDLGGAPKETGDPLGTSRMGPVPFLEFLETHCGIVPARQSRIERLAAFMGVLAENGERFPSYRASWLNAPLASAARMLDWVDDWYLHGWDGRVAEPVPSNGDVRRVIELMSLEREARSVVAPGIGLRLLTVSQALRAGIRVPAERVDIVDDREDWPAAWLRAFDLLPCEWKAWRPQGPSPGVSVVRFDSSVTAARALGDPSFFGTQGGKTVRLYEDDSPLRDEVLIDIGRPQTGTRGNVSGDPASQIFPLALSLYRDPPDMKDWLGFLSLPVCPLGSLRHALARTIAETGGINGDKWRAAIDHADESRGSGESRAASVSEWLPQTRYPDSAFPRSVILEVAARVSAYLRGRDGDFGTDAALERVSAFARAIELLGPSYATVNWSIVGEILAMAQVTGRENAANRREAGAEPIWRAAGSLTEPCDTLVWYLPQRPSQERSWPWFEAEMKCLSRVGCAFPDLATMSARQLKVTRRVIALAGKRIVLAVPSDGDRQSLAELVLLGGTDKAPVTVISGERYILSGDFAETAPVPARPLPPLARWWDIATDLSPDGEWNCSFTALDDFLERPAKWLMKYRAGIRNGSTLSLPDVSRFMGTCAHKMTETFFDVYGERALSLGIDEYDRWFDETFSVVVEQLAFPLLSADLAHARIAFGKRLRSSILSLRDFLRGVDARRVRFEQPLSGACFDAIFSGYADLVFENGAGRTGIIDMKYSQGLSRFKKKMESDMDIQLTIYAELWKQACAETPETAYWLFPKEKLIARNADFYPGAIALPTVGTHADRLGKIAETVAWRKAQLAEGKVEVVCDATQKLVDELMETVEDAPADGLPLGNTNDGFDDYLGLYGWSDMA